MTMRCAECGGTEYTIRTVPVYIEDLGGVVVQLIDAVKEYTCNACGETEVEIPDLRGLVKVAALARALIPVQLRGTELRFLRRALDINQQEFADAMELSAETVSRWENNVQGIGGMSEKLVRHNICALLYKDVPSSDYDPADITNMRIIPADACNLPPIPVKRVVVKHDRRREDAWDANTKLAA